MDHERRFLIWSLISNDHDDDDDEDDNDDDDDEDDNDDDEDDDDNDDNDDDDDGDDKSNVTVGSRINDYSSTVDIICKQIPLWSE